MPQAAESSRIAWVDLVRAVAMTGVVTIHTAGQAMAMPASGGPTTEWQIGNIINALARLSVPLFFMISGALILGKSDEPMDRFVKKRLGKIAVPFITWSLFYFLFHALLESRVPGPSAWASLLWKPAHYHLWFFYSILGLYLVAPLLRSFLRDHGGRYLAVLWLLTIPGFLFLGTFTSLRFEPNFDRILPIFIGFFFGGFMLKDTLVSRGGAWIALAILLLGWVATAWGNTWCLFEYKGAYPGYFTDYLSLNVVAMSIAAFLLLRRAGEAMGRESGLGLRLVRLVADCGMGVFVLHPLILDGLNLLPVKVNANLVHPLIGIPLTLSLAMLLSVLVVSVLRRIPFVRAAL